MRLLTRFELGPNQPTDEVSVFASEHHPNQVAIFVLVLVFNRLADDLRDRLDPALRSER